MQNLNEISGKNRNYSEERKGLVIAPSVASVNLQHLHHFGECDRLLSPFVKVVLPTGLKTRAQKEGKEGAGKKRQWE
jgi:hypothetical protein